MSGQAEVNLSLSELRALITKSARGAGMEWGMAEEAGWAAEWLARRGLPAALWAADWLDARIGGVASPVEHGVALADAARGAGQSLSDLTLPDGLPAPGYLLPFLHLALGSGRSLALTSPAGLVARIGSTGAVMPGPAWQERTAGWVVTKNTESLPSLEPVTRAKVSASLLDCLEGLALRTTVPPSAASRRDAGSAGGDND